MTSCFKGVLTEWERLSIVEPLHFHVGVSNGSKLALKLGRLHFLEARDALDLSDKPRWLPALRVVHIILSEEHLGCVLPHRGLHLNQVFRLLHALWNLIFKLDCWHLLASQFSPCYVLAKLIESLANILTLIFLICIRSFINMQY